MINSYLTIAGIYDDLKNRLCELELDRSVVVASRRIIKDALIDGKPIYGVNTGFGALAGKSVDPEDLAQLQANLILSHAVGAGELIPKDISRLMLHLKIHALSLGHSGISLETFDRLLWFAEEDLIPTAPSKGSLGASGDLAPLAHMALPLIGRGQFWNTDGIETVDAARILKEAGLEPLELQPKDGLALINGTQMMAAYGVHILHRALDLVKTADILAAMSLEALQGSLTPFDERLHQIRPYKGSGSVASNIRKLLVDSEILESHRFCGKVQDPYSLRCVPQVHGASRGSLEHVRDVFEIEINAVTDNPVIFENGDILSGGNFHGEPLAMALDYAGIALAELASISERRIYLLLEGHDGLPLFLVENSGINSGLMILQYTAAALVSENKVLAHPASVDSIPTSHGQEDHVSMGATSAVKLYEIMSNLERVLAIEAVTSAQALDFRKPLKPGRGVNCAHQLMREKIPHHDQDRLLYEDMKVASRMVRNHVLVKGVESEIGPLQ